MVTMAQRIEELRTKKAMSRPALAAALGLPRLSIEKFETGRQTPTQEQQQKLASAFGVSIAYLRGETDDPTSMDNWLSGAVPAEDPVVLPKAVRKATAAVVAQSGDSKSDGTGFQRPAEKRLLQGAGAGDRTGGAEIPGGTGLAGQGRQKVNRKLHNAPSAKADGALLSLSQPAESGLPPDGSFPPAAASQDKPFIL